MTGFRARLLASALTAASLAPMLPGAVLAQAADRGIAALLEQANYWKQQNRNDQALRAYERVLAIDPRNADALAGAAEVQAELGNRSVADQLLQRLRQAAPEPSVAAEADRNVRGASADPAALAEARRLAQAGQRAQAIARYRQIFGGSTPPDAFALEYYQTLAGMPEGKQEAVQGLRRLADRNPNDPRLNLALGQVLTYDEGTRSQGIDRLRQLAARPDAPPAAIAAWKEALGWQGANPAAIPALEAYLQRFPNDQQIAAQLQQARNPPEGPRDQAGDARGRGFDSLNSGRTAAAQADFEAALAANPNDPDALGGLGLVRLRQGRNAEARQLLARAISLDPDGRRKWGRALDGASFTGEVNTARAQLLRGNVDQAEQALLRAVRRDTGERADAEALLGDIALRRNDPVGAEQRYRAALARRPNLPGALAGLYDSLQQQGRFAEAEQLQARAGSAFAAASGGQRADALRAEAARTEDPEAAIALLRGAQASDPASPWIRLDLARALAKQGRGAEGWQVMQEGLADRPSNDALYAAALYANEEGRSQDAARLIERIPDRLRTADATALLRRTRISEQVAAAAEPARWGRIDIARARLMQLASRPDPSGAIPAEVVRVLNAIGDPRGAAEAARLAAGVNRGAPPSGRLAIANALLEAGLVNDAALAGQALASDPRLTQDERRQVAGLQSGVAIRSSDALNEAGNQAAAYDRLAPALAADPQNASANLALARLYQGAREPRDAQRIAEAVLQRDPRNTDARGSAMDAAIALKDWGRAEALLAEGRALMPNDPRISMLEARLARAWGDGRRARNALEAAAMQRRNQLGADASPPGMAPPGIAAPVAPGVPSPYDNPFRRTPLSGDGRRSAAEGNVEMAQAGYPAPAYPAAAYQGQAYQAPAAAYPQQGYQASPYASPAPRFGQPVQQAQAVPILPRAGMAVTPNDPLLGEIDRQLREVNEETAPRMVAAVNYRGRSGDGGLDKLTEFGGTAEGSFAMPGIGGRVTARVSPVSIDAGDTTADNGTLRRYGSNALVLPNPATAATAAQVRQTTPRDTSATGVALGLAYARPNFSADIGSTPMGFREQNVVGGLEIAPELSPGLRLRLTGERRAMTDSLLSWAGARDPISGRTWGGVTRTGGRAQLEYVTGPTSFYVMGGYSKVEGSGVAENDRIEAGTGIAHNIFQTPDEELVTGLDLTYFAYDKNLSYFTLGHGGYFSPQTYIGATIPLDYRARSGDFTYRLGGTIGVASFKQDRSPIFPNDPALQAQLQARANADATIQTSYAGQNQTGVIGGLRADLEYALTPQLRLGGLLRYDRSADWNEARGMLYARYRFDR
jgi:Tfp pilus assembly protein PilF